MSSTYPNRFVLTLLNLCLAAASLGLGPGLSPSALGAPSWQLQVRWPEQVAGSPCEGRLLVAISSTNSPEPRLALGHTGTGTPQALGRDLQAFGPGRSVLLDGSTRGFPHTNLAGLPPGDYVVQAVFDRSADIRLPNAPGNIFSRPQPLHVEASGCSATLELSQQVPAEQAPAETAQLRFITLDSPLLSRFHGRPMTLRAGIVLPRDYEREPTRRYPLWVRVGGLSARYSSVQTLMKPGSAFSKTWQADATPRFILLQLDGAGPFGDPYYVNSANNGPYGDALVQELIPHVEARFRAIGKPQGRVLSGNSTGGWVSLALQVFYPDFFNGTWSSCPDPVDFRALELVNIYSDANAFVNRRGYARPSQREATSDISLLLREEVEAENLLGRGDSFTGSGQQWGAWNAAFGPRGANGQPLALFDPHSGQLDRAVAEQWKRYDLHLVLEQNWPTLGPKLAGKLHLTAGESDVYFLNNAVHLLDEFLSQAKPPYGGSIHYGAGKGHGWSNLTLPQMLEEMKAATSS